MRGSKVMGMTLIELLIVVVIVGVLAAVAVPSYQDYLRQARRADVKSVLLEVAQHLERSYTTNNCYNWGGAACTANAATVTGLLPASLQRAPKDAAVNAQLYDISLSAVTRSTFTLQAVPKAGNAMAGDACGTYTIDNRGVQGTSGTVAACWDR